MGVTYRLTTKTRGMPTVIEEDDWERMSARLKLMLDSGLFQAIKLTTVENGAELHRPHPLAREVRGKEA